MFSTEICSSWYQYLQFIYFIYSFIYFVFVIFIPGREGEEDQVTSEKLPTLNSPLIQLSLGWVVMQSCDKWPIKYCFEERNIDLYLVWKLYLKISAKGR